MWLCIWHEDGTVSRRARVVLQAVSSVINSSRADIWTHLQ